MILDISRHKFFEGLATLLLFATVMAIATSVSYIPAESEAVTTMTPIGLLVGRFALSHPLLSVVCVAVIMVYSVLRLARATARAMLYPQGTLAAISLGAVTLLALLPSANYAYLAVVALLMCETFGRLIYCFDPNIRAHYLFTAMLALGTLPLVDGALSPLVVVVVVLTILLRSTMRETIVTLVGVVSPLFVCCYIEWLAMGDFEVPILAVREALMASSLETIIDYLTLPRLIFIGVMIAAAAVSIMLYFTNRVSLGVGVRNVWLVLLMSAAVLAVSIFLGGFITPGVIVAMAIIFVPMLPMLFICAQPLTAVLAYVLFVLASFVALI